MIGGFRNWLLNEMPHVIVSDDLVIDLKFELNPNPELRLITPYSKWYAKLPSGNGFLTMKGIVEQEPEGVKLPGC